MTKRPSNMSIEELRQKQKEAERKYKITVTKDQLSVLIKATEMIARLGIGQFRDALEYLPLREFLPDGWHEDMVCIGEILSKYTINGVDGWHSNLGINSNDVNENSRVAWDLYQVLRHRVAWDRAVKEGVVENTDSPRKWPEMMFVHYDEPMKTSFQPLASIEKLND